MRFLTIAFLILALIIFYGGCDKDNSSGSNGNQSIIGTWLHVKSTEIVNESGGTFSDTWEYNHQLDNYHSALFLQISKDKILILTNAAGLDYNIETAEYEITENNIILTYDYGELENDTLRISFEGNFLVFEWHENWAEGYANGKDYFTKFKDDFPPKSWTTALQNDNQEPDDNARNSTAINAGSNSAKQVITSGDIDWFNFQADSGATYLIKVMSYMDNALTLYDIDGSSVIAEDDDNDDYYEVETLSYLSPVLVWECVASGKYYFEISGYDAEEEGYYYVSLSLTELEPPPSYLRKSLDSKKDKRRHHRLF